ncbi:ATP-dependent DNA helicase Q4 isoform X2 [Ceratina calcarata]|uniref:DNA 3'-5' helicase n=1 Tax=Ceratina calcarata TaxID=156304 RepID=A0AAJ7IRG4_9HYME|nr:ATP-dependent DNA helicase Q4 isoform X2 [Ceratina calcarata]
MEILEDPVFKSQYQKYKIRVKLWESRFTKEHGRKPNKNDIKEADMKIKESYKMYWKLKTQALEETLTDITFSDDDVPPKTVENTPVDEIKHNKPLRDSNSQSIENMCEYDKQQTENTHENSSEKIDLGSTNKENVENTGSTSSQEHNSSVTNTPIDKENPDNKDNEISKTTDIQDGRQSALDNVSENKDEYKNVNGVWGDHLSKANEQVPKKKQSLLVGRSSSFQLSQNKFTSLSLTKRNPRKSLSAPKLKKLTSHKDINVSKNVPEHGVNTEGSNTDSLVVEETTSAFGESVKVSYMENKPATQSIATVQQLIEGYTVHRNINAGWLDRCSRQSNLTCPVLDSKRLSGTSDSGIELVDSNVQSPKENVPVAESQKSFQISDEEDFVCNSDTEEELRKKRIRNFKKRLSDQENPSKKLCTTTYDNLNTMQTLRSSTNDNTIFNVEKNIILNDPNITTVEINDANNSTNDIKDCNKKIENVSETADTHETVEKPRPVNRKIRRRIKHISSDDSDSDYNENSEEEEKKTRTKRVGKTKGSATTSKNKSGTKPKRTYRKKMDLQDEDDVSGIGTTRKSKGTKKTKNEAKPKRATRKKKDVESEPDNDDLETEGSKRNHIYGIETLKAVPRFAISKSSQGDLIQQFATSVSSKDDTESTIVPRSTKGKYLTDKEKLEKKIADGKMNENFVRINLKKKVFVRGKKHFNFSKYKKNQWKERKKELESGEGSLAVADFVEKIGTHGCFICGERGHFSRRCPKRKGDDLVPLDEIDEDSEFPTLEQAQEMASKNAIVAHASRIDRLPEKPSYSSIKTGESAEPTNEETKHWNDDLWEPIEDEELLCGHKIPEELVQQLLPPEKDVVQPLYRPNEDQSLIDTPTEVFETLRMFGHTTFRPGQEKAIMRILSGQSTLVTLSTGSGKSLCYQLPAYLYSKYSNSITLVISPLVSLMDDQVTGVPAFLSAACLHTNQTQKVRDNVMLMVKNGQLNILLISPEAVVAGEKSTGFGALLRQLPPIAFACIDEAHCISQWSHNFRPSYLMVCRVLKEKLRVRTVLALTATATKSTAESIVSHLGIHDGMAGVISDIPMPRNLLLTVSKDENRDRALVNLLLSERFKECDSVIVYCTRREECVRIAGLLRTSLQNTNNYENSKSKLSSIAEAYHAGLSAYRRKTVQKAFMNGQTRIVVATVAFGMGLNKPDIRAVIHYNMPGTFEGYVQEVGRAGRDGLPAHCHLFLNPTEDKDKWELRRHIYANGVDRHMIRRLLQKVFIPCSCGKLREKNASYRCPGHEVAIPIDETVEALDIPEEIISTLLCYLELHPRRFITVLSSVYVKARVSSYNGPQGLKQAAQSSPPLAMAIAMELQKGVSHDDSSVIEFPVVDIASAIGWDSGIVKSHLKNLEWKTVNGASKRSAISVRYDTLGLRVKAPGDLTDEELDEALDALYSRTQTQENAALQQLETIGVTLHKFSVSSVNQCLAVNDEMNSRSDQLKDVIRSYFAEGTLLDIDMKRRELENEAQIASDVRNLIMSYRDNSFTGRAVARIFHGIQSPNYPAYVWNKCRFWRAHLPSDFNALCLIATREILALR